jgi:choline dehydrogenase-like flavoprotein
VQQGLRGAALDRALRDRSTREINMAGLVEQLPLPENRIVPDFDRRDALGLPRPRIAYRIDDYSRKALDQVRRIAAEVGAAMKATEIHHGREIVSSGHIIGTYRMGRDSSQSVVDPDQRAHDHPNLFLLGSGVFPTSAASNPTLTIAALALRSVNRIRSAVAG